MLLSEKLDISNKILTYKKQASRNLKDNRSYFYCNAIKDRLYDINIKYLFNRKISKFKRSILKIFDKEIVTNNEIQNKFNTYLKLNG